jgi:hypothetical protein
MPGECWWCRRTSTRFCDTRLTEKIEEEHEYEIAGRKFKHRRFVTWRDLGTCDAEICDECTEDSRVHINMGENRHAWDSFDKCPYCRSRGASSIEQADPGVWRAAAREHGRKAKMRCPP